MIEERKDYLGFPGNETCYDYMLSCYKKISSDAGEYPAFVTFDCKTMMKNFIEDIEKTAAALSFDGFERGDVLTIFLPTTPHAYVLFYALSKLGIIANFVHPLTPPEALREILENTKSKGIFILDRASGAYERILKNTYTVICRSSDYTFGAVHDAVFADDEKNSCIPQGDSIHLFKELLDRDCEKVETIKNPGNDPAVYLHGSGTTGKSKTVILSAKALNQSAYCQYFLDKYHDYGNSYCLGVLPCFHSFGVSSGIHYCVCNAYTNIIMSKFDPVKANDYIKRYKVQYIAGAPSMYQKMMIADNFCNEGLKNLNCVYSGGDITAESFIEEFDEALKKAGGRGRLFRGWGLTETCGICSCNSHFAERKDSIGLASKGVTVKVIDENGDELPANTNGELAVTGDNLMLGYLDDGTADGSGIFTDENGTPWVHTGDMGYIDEDGFIFFTGRKKRIIVISAYNIYPYSMEQKVMSIPFIKEACAVQGYDERSKPYVKLCISLKDTRLDEDEVKNQVMSFCRENLDHFSVPRKIVIMDNLPRTKMDKLDFMAMSDPVPTSAQKELATQH